MINLICFEGIIIIIINIIQQKFVALCFIQFLLGIAETFPYSKSTFLENNIAARCASGANVWRDINVFGTKTLSLTHIYNLYS
jgi:hypothetical protein